MRALLPFLSLFKQARFYLILGVLLMIVGTAASIGLMTLSGWFLAATAIAGAGTLFNFFYPSAGVRGLAIGRTAARYVEKIVTHDATFRVLAKLRVLVFSRIIPLSPAVLNQYRNSDLLNRLVSDVDTLDSLYLRLIAPFVTALVIIIAMTIGLSFVNLPIALLIGASLLVLLLLIPTLFYQLGKSFGAKLTQSRSQYRIQFVEFVQAQAELLLFNAQDRAQQKLEEIESCWQAYQQKEANLSGFSTALLVFCNGLLVVAVLWFAADADLGSGLYQAAMIALLTFSALASFEILMPLGAAFLHIGQVIASAERVNELINQTPPVVFQGAKTLRISSEKPLVCAENLSFRYPNRTDFALNGLSLRLEPQQKIALLGKTGSGKSTLLQLLVRNYDPQQGQLTLGGEPVYAYSEAALRDAVCFLTQRVHVFSDSLRQNLQIANAQRIEDSRMLQVLDQVDLSSLAAQGLDLWLGDGGRPLSGGEQRRLGIARVLLNEAPIILLDEPTEGLDRETERHILSLLLAHSQGKSLIMVTHRLTALAQFDEICVMDNGRLAEQGSYSSLLQENGMFKAFVERI